MEFHKVTKNEVVQFSESQLSEVISYVLPALQKVVSETGRLD